MYFRSASNEGVNTSPDTPALRAATRASASVMISAAMSARGDLLGVNPQRLPVLIAPAPRGLVAGRQHLVGERGLADGFGHEVAPLGQRGAVAQIQIGGEDQIV